MKRIVLGVLLVLGSASAAQMHQSIWPKERTVSAWLKENNLSDLLEAIPSTWAERVRTVSGGQPYFELRRDGQLIQALIPIGDGEQIHLAADADGYALLQVESVTLREHNEAVSFPIGEGLVTQMRNRIGYGALANALSRLFEDADLFRHLQPKDRVAFLYTQAEYMGYPVGAPRIEAALITVRGQAHFAYRDRNGTVRHTTHRTERYKTTEKRPFTYTTIQNIQPKTFRMPLDRVRITSRFSHRRWHPILKKYLPHHGVDFGAPTGTPLRAINSGKVIFAGWKGGYGKAVKIDHGNGWVSLYGHMSRITVHSGERVQRGSIIGRTGNTGRSTGPHLHLGLYRHGVPVDPLKYIAKKGVRKPRTVQRKHTVLKTYTVTRTRTVAIPEALQIRRQLEQLIQHPTRHPYRWLDTGSLSIPVRSIDTNRTQSKEIHHG